MVRSKLFLVPWVFGFISQFAPVIACEDLQEDLTTEAKPAQSLKVGDLAPALKVTKWLQGDAIVKFELGKVYVVEFWATWCGPCIANMPHLAELQARYKEQGVMVIGFTSRDILGVPDNTEETVTAFVRKRGPALKYSFAYADDAGMADPWMKGQEHFRTIVVDKAGRIAYMGHPMFLDLALPKIVVDGASAKSVGDEMAKAVAEYQTVLATLNRDAKAGLQVLKDFEAKYPPLTDLLPMVRVKLIELPKQGKPGEAKQYAETLVAKAIKQKDIRLLELASSILRNEKESKELMALAVRAAEARVGIDGGKDAQSLLSLADAYFALGDKAKAKEYASKAVDSATGESSALQEYIERETRRLGMEK